MEILNSTVWLYSTKMQIGLFDGRMQKSLLKHFHTSKEHARQYRDQRASSILVIHGSQPRVKMKELRISWSIQIHLFKPRIKMKELGHVCAEATWVDEEDCRKKGISSALLSTNPI